MAQLISFLWWFGGVILGLALAILIILYIRGTFRSRINYKVENPPSPEEPRFLLALASLSNSLSTSGFITGFWVKADEIQPVRLDAISRAEHTLHFETFFITPGHRANDFAAAIAERAAAGVKVQLIVDSYGTKTMPKRYWRRLRSAGVQVRFFNGFDWKAPSTYAGRTHRKLLLIDGKVALIGGAGISDHWDGLKKIGDTEPWLDVEVRLEGSVVAILEGIFMQHWTYAGGLASLGREIFNPDTSEEPTILVTPGDVPTYRSSAIRALFQTSILAAKKRIWLASPYLLPDPNSREFLMIAKDRGVDVRILTDGKCSDKKYVHYASYELYGELLAAGIEIYEYQPSMMHAKLLLIDDQWVSTGSANFDPRSFFHNDELNISTGEPKLVQHIERLFDEAFDRCQLVSLEDWQKRSVRQRIIGHLVRFIQWQL